MSSLALTSHVVRVLGLSPRTAGCGFAVIEKEEGLLAWGVAELPSGNSSDLLARINTLVERYQPTAICLESSSETNRRQRARDRLDLVASWARKHGLTVVALSRLEVRRAFRLPSGATNHDTAVAVVAALPQLAVYLPAKRRLWESEPRALRMFEAVAFASATMRA
jgi:hypothetical protein